MPAAVPPAIAAPAAPAAQSHLPAEPPYLRLTLPFPVFPSQDSQSDQPVARPRPVQLLLRDSPQQSLLYPPRTARFEKSGLMADSAQTKRRHKGDIMSPETRSALMSRIRGKDTGPELIVASALKELGLEFENHAKDLPGRPDFVFREKMVAVFVDGDFWHGWYFPRWRDKLSEKWEAKIEQNRKRDARNRRRLRRMGWRVVRVWEHQINDDLQSCVERIRAVLVR